MADGSKEYYLGIIIILTVYLRIVTSTIVPRLKLSTYNAASAKVALVGVGRYIAGMGIKWVETNGATTSATRLAPYLDDYTIGYSEAWNACNFIASAIIGTTIAQLLAQKSSTPAGTTTNSAGTTTKKAGRKKK
ncbi:hypothetical protein TRVA0_042S01134 [Trichomonascus vanleenenianus]|uniref:uncharacterized protein n=1 Tax=Trichomonascus vanleenenianus TaxID=2268995 RepID=UPI003EC9B42C